MCEQTSEEKTPATSQSADCDFGAQLRALAQEFHMTPAKLGQELIRMDASASE